MDVQKSQRPPFTVFGIVRFFKSNNFCPKIRFSQAQHPISDFFSRLVFFCYFFFKKCFHRSPSLIFTRSETFCERKGLFKVFGTMRLTGELQKKIRIFHTFLGFFKGFPLRKMFFLLFPVGEEWFSRLMRILSGLFWRCKINEIIMSFYPWFSV